MKRGLSGYTVVRNALTLDYPIRLTVDSLIKVCDEVIICDSGSTDGTREFIDMMIRDCGKIAYSNWRDKVRVIDWPWPEPVADWPFFLRWLNFTREHCRYDMQLQLDADEVLDDSPSCLQTIRDTISDGKRACRTFNRLNFWRDPQSLIPEGQCVGKYVTRLGKTEYYMPSDEPHSTGEMPILDEAERHPDLRIFHLGFLREQSAFYRKAKVMGKAIFNNYDHRLAAAEDLGKPLWESECAFTDQLVPYEGTYPIAVAEWLRERGHTVPGL